MTIHSMKTQKLKLMGYTKFNYINTFALSPTCGLENFWKKIILQRLEHKIFYYDILSN